PRTPAGATGARSRRLGLRFLDDDRPALKDAAGQLLDGRLRALVVHGLDEREAAGAAGVAVERDPDAPHLDSLPGESFPELLLVDVVRKVSDEKASTHRSSLCCLCFPR